ncbi:MAG: MbnH family di-heme enzyme [Myxococcota bacterium]|nr:MbnH family di-heme enzyme [Myxococcota bacterium]
MREERHTVWIGLVIIGLGFVTPGCGSTKDDDPWEWELPGYATPPWTPDHNPMSASKVELGRHLFYEPRISMTGTISCGSCHEQERGFATQMQFNDGATGDATPRNAQPLGNVAYASYLTWGNLTLRDLERQALNPLFGDNPIELGAGFIEGSSNHYDLTRLEELVDQDPRYGEMFEDAFPHLGPEDRLTWDRAIDAIACFQRSLLSFESPYDRFLAGDEGALSEEAERGRQLFFSETTRCGDCHSGPLLSVAFPVLGESPTLDELFRNTGLYYLTEGSSSYFDGSISHYPEPNMGIGEFSQNPADDGKHRVPSLRNIGLTAPYRHDGSVATLGEVLEHYAQGGRVLVDGPYAGDGGQNPNKDDLIAGFELTEQDKSDLIAFLHSLTDTDFISNPAFSNPHEN